MRQELYIDGTLADIDEKTSVTMTINSNLTRDISQLSGNTTYTIQLPATTHNKKLIANADIIAANSQYPYIFHTAKYIRDGVEIISKGVAVLVGIGDSIEILITWGVSSALSNLFASDAQLNDLTASDTITYLSDPTITKWVDFESVNYCYAFADYNKPLEDAEEWANVIEHDQSSTEDWLCSYLRPVVRVPWILDLIASQYGVTFDWSQATEAQAFINTLVIPLTKDEPIEETNTSDTITIAGGRATSTASIMLWLNHDNSGGVFEASDGTVTEVVLGSTAKDVTFFVDSEVTLSREDTSMLWAGQLSGVQFRVQLYDENGDAVDDSGLTATYKVISKTETSVTFKANDQIDVEMQAGWMAGLYIEAANTDSVTSTAFYTAFVQKLMDNGQIFYAAGSSEHIQFGQEYPITHNLPEIKIVDFVKMLAAITGTFPLQPNGNSVSFVPFSLPWDNRVSPLDWTRRIIPAYEDERPRSMSYTLTQYARNNWYKWKVIDDYGGSLDGNLQIPNETLEKERDVVTYPLGLPKIQKTYRWARIPIFQLSNYDELVEGSTTTPTYDINTAGDYLCVAHSKHRSRYITGSDADVAIGTDGLNMQEIINSKYSYLTASLGQAVIIKEKVRLNDVDILEFDPTIPVYLAQYGAFFAVLSIQSDSDGTAEVEMLKL